MQISAEPILETYTPLFVNKIKCKKISQFIYEYGLVKKNSLIKMTNIKYRNTLM